MRLATFLATASGFLAPLNVAAAARCSSGVRLGSKSASSRRHALAPDARSAPKPSTRLDANRPDAENDDDAEPTPLRVSVSP